jgi:hypothetical protein
MRDDLLSPVDIKGIASDEQRVRAVFRDSPKCSIDLALR